jgi:hypothetical protein
MSGKRGTRRLSWLVVARKQYQACGKGEYQSCLGFVDPQPSKGVIDCAETLAKGTEFLSPRNLYSLFLQGGAGSKFVFFDNCKKLSSCGVRE